MIMKKLILLSLVCLFFGFSQNAFAQTCNDPNAHNTGEMAPCETCFDGILNGDELEVDCGGTNPSCPPCDFERRLDVVGDARILGETELGGATDIVEERLFYSREGADGFNISFNNDYFDDATGDDFLIFEKTDGNTSNPDGGFLFTNTGNDGIEETVMAIKGNGRVGIGTIFPVTELHVEGTTLLNNQGAGAQILILNTERPWAFRQYSSGATTALRLSALDFNNNNKNFLINTSGNIGIGTDLTPDYTLEVTGSAGKPGGGSWSNSSDRRLKQDIEDYKDGLEEILQIRPVWYRYNGKFGLPTEERYVGIIAQEMQEVAPYTITPYIETDDETGESGEYLSYNGTAVTYMLVNAVQEQQEIIEQQNVRIQQQEETIEELKNYNAELEVRLQKLETLLLGKTNNPQLNQQTTSLTDAKLFPNQPNPFTEKTLIRYYIPQGSTQAEIRIANLEGKVIKTVAIQENGEGQLTVNAHSLSAGTYLYSLLVNGELIATEKMILTGKN